MGNTRRQRKPLKLWRNQCLRYVKWMGKASHNVLRTLWNAASRVLLNCLGIRSLSFCCRVQVIFWPKFHLAPQPNEVYQGGHNKFNMIKQSGGTNSETLFGHAAS